VYEAFRGVMGDGRDGAKRIISSSAAEGMGEGDRDIVVQKE